MSKVFGRFAILFAAAILAASIPLTASAQLVDVAESDASSARVVVHYGALFADVRDALRPYVPVGSDLPSLQAIARDNHGRMLYVCYDQPAGMRPSLSRERAAYDACSVRREIWFVAGARPFLIRFRRAASSTDELPPSYTELQTQILERDEALARRAAEHEADVATATSLRRMLEARETRISQLESQLEQVPEAAPAAPRNSGGLEWLFAVMALVAVGLILFGIAKELMKRADERGAKRARMQAVIVLKRNRLVIDKRGAEIIDLRERLRESEGLRSAREQEMTRSKTKAEQLKRSIAEAFEEKGKYRPLERRVFQLRSQIELLNKLRKSSEEGPFARFTTPALDAMIAEAEAEFANMRPKPSVVLEKMDEIRGRIASLLTEAIGFYDDSLAIDADLLREKEKLEDLQTEAEKRKQVYGQLFTELLKASSEIMPLRQTAIEERARLEAEREFLQKELVLVGDERDARQAERLIYETEIGRLEGDLKSARRELAECRRKLEAEESKTILGLIEEELKTPKAQARNKGALRGLKIRIAELEGFIADAQAAFQKKHHDYLESEKERIRLRGLLAEKEMELMQLRPRRPLVVVGYDEKPPGPGEPSPTHH